MLISTDVWVAALVRRAELAGASAVIVRKGDARAGAVLVKAGYDPDIWLVEIEDRQGRHFLVEKVE